MPMGPTLALLMATGCAPEYQVDKIEEAPEEELIQGEVDEEPGNYDDTGDTEDSGIATFVPTIEAEIYSACPMLALDQGMTNEDGYEENWATFIARYEEHLHEVMIPGMESQITSADIMDGEVALTSIANGSTGKLTYSLGDKTEAYAALGDTTNSEAYTGNPDIDELYRMTCSSGGPDSHNGPYMNVMMTSPYEGDDGREGVHVHAFHVRTDHVLQEAHIQEYEAWYYTDGSIDVGDSGVSASYDYAGVDSGLEFGVGLESMEKAEVSFEELLDVLVEANGGQDNTVHLSTASQDELGL